MSQGPYNLFVGELTASNDSGSATVTGTYGTIDLGDARDKFTLAVGVTGGSFSPTFATDAAAYVAGVESVEASGDYTANTAIPIPVGNAEVILQGSLDGASWYTLTAVTTSIATTDGTTLTVGSAVTAVVSGAPAPLARFLQAKVTITLAGVINLVLDYRNVQSINTTDTVTSLTGQLSIYVAASHEV